MNTEHTCKNCGHEIAENFCPNCGQKKYKRIDGKYIKDEIQYSILHTNKGFFYTIKNLIKNPGKTVRDYLDGNRVNHYKPILLAFVMSGISTYISFKILKMGKIFEEIPAKMNYKTSQSLLMADYSNFVQSYNTFIYMMMIPCFALASFLTFRKLKQNYYEHIVINSYLYVVYVLFCMIFMYPLMYFIQGTNASLYISALTMFGFVFIFPWFFKNLYPQLNKSKIWLNTFVFCLLSGLLYFFAIFVGATIYIIYEISTKGIEVMKPA